MDRSIREKIDLLWGSYDIDQSGSLDKDETREFLRDILTQLDLTEGFNDNKFEILFR